MQDTWHGGAGEYVVAGADCFVSLFKDFNEKYDGSQFFDYDKVNDFIRNNVDRYLYSFGTGLSYKSKKISDKHVSRIVREVTKINEPSFMNQTKVYIDSGGFQVAMGAIDAKDMPYFIKLYDQFLRENHKLFSYAFSLDLPPGPTSSIDVFKSYQEIEELNRLSYQTINALPQEIKDKMIYIHHFRTPSLFETWSKFLWQENLADGFKNFATGGIVANSATDIVIPVIIYSIPLSEVLRYVKTKGMKKFNFHVLGGANFTDVFYHKLFAYHIKKVHDIDVTITYDSSAIFKALIIGRFIPVFQKNGNLIKMDLKSRSLHLRFDDNTIEQKVYEICNELHDNYGFKKLTLPDDPIYSIRDIKGKPEEVLHRSTHMYLICCYLRLYRRLEYLCEDFVKDVYKLYEEQRIDEFDDKCHDFTRALNGGKKTRKQKAKQASIYKSLQILTDMDHEYNKHLIEKFMGSDDISAMSGSGIVRFK
jgi:hypothetical protein